MLAEHVKFMNDSHYYEGEKVSFMKTGLKIAGLIFKPENKADTKFFSEDAYKRAKDHKELYVVDGATHVDLYDKPEFVVQVVEKLTEFFNKNIK